MRGTTINITAQLVTEECYKCHVLFALPEDMQERLKKSHDSFYCPAGHSQAYVGKTQEEILREKLRAAKDDALYYQSQMEQEQAAKKQAKKELAVERRKMTMLSKRVTAGVCPHCNRSFKQLSRHMQCKHPEQAHDAGLPERENIA